MRAMADRGRALHGRRRRRPLRRPRRARPRVGRRRAPARSSRCRARPASGKSTLLRVIAGLLAAGLRAGGARRRATSPTCRPTGAASAWCSRTSSCSRTATWRSNVGFGLRMARRAAARRATARVGELLDARRPGRVRAPIGHLARAVARRSAWRSRDRSRRDPAVLLLDEPLTGPRPRAPRRSSPTELARLLRVERHLRPPRHPRCGRGRADRRPGRHAAGEHPGGRSRRRVAA